MTTKEAAARLKVTHGRVKQLVADGDLPAEKMGGCNLISDDALKAYLQRLEDRTGPGRIPNVLKERLPPPTAPDPGAGE